MPRFAIHNKLTGGCIGEFEAATHDGALDAAARADGYPDYAAICRASLVIPGEFVVELLK